KASITLKGESTSPLELSEMLGVYPDVHEGAHLFRRVDAHGVEDYLQETTPRDEVSVAYDVSLDHVAGVRFVSGVLELLDESGAPRLRATAPLAVDAEGVRRAAHLEVSGCAYDTDPTGPWGRAIVAPGSGTCTVVAKVDARGLAFPVLLDPAW